MEIFSPENSPSTPDFSSTNTTPPRNFPDLRAAYATLITSPSYLPGALILAHTLKRHDSQFPLILMYTGLPAHYIPTLELEAKRSNIILHETTLLNISTNSDVAPRFAHTWTKLQVFSLYRTNWDRICFLDADIMILGPMDDLLLNLTLSTSNTPGESCKLLAVNHICVCNLDADPWAPPTWTPQNCAYHSPLTKPTPIHLFERVPDVPQTTSAPHPNPHPHPQLNSGLFIFAPSLATWTDMWDFIRAHHPELSTYQFPDQDLLTAWWRNRWISIGWRYNALKTWRSWHPEMWRNDDVRALHYMVDKPWRARVSPDMVAGYRGEDKVTHSWWWEAYVRWEKERLGEGEVEGKGKGKPQILQLMEGLVAPPNVTLNLVEKIPIS